MNEQQQQAVEMATKKICDNSNGSWTDIAHDMADEILENPEKYGLVSKEDSDKEIKYYKNFADLSAKLEQQIEGLVSKEEMFEFAEWLSNEIALGKSIERMYEIYTKSKTEQP